ncbi:hypothetical protein DFH06DRAFT_1415479 [Mycena polygramma]|nr:hypothetical protein DFH06DRAFT_1415479 [Mycena polygramma]
MPASPSSSGTFSMPSAASSSGASLARVPSKTSMGSSQSPRRRPRSPPSMYIPYETAPAKAPKPLIKLDKKKTKSPTTRSEPSYPNPFPPTRSSTSSSSSPAVSDAPRRRPSVTSFLSLRRTAASEPRPSPSPMSTAPRHDRPIPPTLMASSSRNDRPNWLPPSPMAAAPRNDRTNWLPPSPVASSPRNNRADWHSPSPIAVSPRNELPRPSLHVPPHRPAHLHQPNIHPVDDLPPMPRRSDKAARMLGKSLPQQPPAHDRGLIVADLSGTFRISPRSSAHLDGNGDGSSASEESESVEDDGGYADDAHFQRDSRLLTPIEFASVWSPAIGASRPSPPSDTGSDVDEDKPEWDENDSEPATPVAPLHRRPSQGRPDPHAHRRHESYASMHDHYSNQPTRESAYMQFRPDPFRPDTPFMDTLVAAAVNSHVAAPRVAPQRALSVVRAEPREGWMGAWNQDDMQDVIHKLRSLKS